MRLGLRARLTLSYLLVLVVSMAIATVLFLHLARNYVERKLGQQLEEEATFIATSLGLNTTEPSDLPLAMDDFAQSFPHVLRARITILSTDGQILSDTAQASGVLSLPDLEEALSGKLGIWTREESGHQIVHATVPIQARGSPIGLVDLSTPLQDQQSYNDIRNLLLVAFGASLPLSWILAAFLARGITRPIARIKEAAQRIAEGELQ
ncbi:MAG: HAMP domain-containing protein, partial [Candidatus Xenobia bacterium]